MTLLLVLVVLSRASSEMVPSIDIYHPFTQHNGDPYMEKNVQLSFDTLTSNTYAIYEAALENNFTETGFVW